jgi:hypothetical protein
VLPRINVTRGVFANFQVVKRNWNAPLESCPWRVVEDRPVIGDYPWYIIPLLKLAKSFMLFFDFLMVASSGGGAVKVLSGLHPYLDVSIVSDVVPSELVVPIIRNISVTSPDLCLPHLKGYFSFVLHGEPGTPRIEIEVVVALEFLLTHIADLNRKLRFLPRYWWKRNE